MARGGHHVGHQPLVAGHVLAHEHQGLSHAGLRGERGLDFTRLDAEATQLHLRVGPAEEVHQPVRPPAGPVSRAVETGTGHAAEGIGDEALRSEGGLAHVTASEAIAADEQLTSGAHGHGLAVSVEHVQPRAADGAADGHGGAHLRRVRHAEAGSEDGGLGGAIAVGEGDTELFEHAARVSGRHDVATGEQLLHRTQGLEVGLHHLGEEACGQPERRHLRITEHLAQLLQGGRLGRHDDEAGAMQQRTPDFERGSVEGDGGQLQQRLVGTEAGEVDAQQGAKDVAVGGAHALGPAGGAGGEVHVGQRVGQGGRSQLMRRLGSERGVVQHHGGESLHREAGQQRARGDERLGPRVLHHAGQSLTRVGRVQRHVSATGLEDGDEGDDELQRALHGERDAGVGTHTKPAQVVRERVGALIELTVGEARGAELDGDVVREAGHHLREDFGQRGLARVVGGLGAPLPQQLPLLGGVHQRQLGQAPLGVRGEALQQRLEVRQQPAHRRLLEEVRAVHRGEAQALGQLGGQHRQVDLAGAAVHRLHFQRQSRHPQRRQGRVLQGEHHLEQRRAAQLALGLECLHQLLEGHVLVGEGAERRLMRPGHQGLEGRVSGQVRAQGERVDEQADEALQLGAVASGHRGADDDVVLAAVARQQHLVRGQQDGEEGAALASGQCLQRLEQRRGQHHREAGTVGAGHGRTGLVRGQLQHGIGVQLLAPVAELRVQRLALEPVALPRGELGILHRQRGQRSGLSRGERGIERAQFANQHAHRPPVGDDVVHVEQQQVLAGAPAVEHRAQQRALLHVEGLACVSVQEAPGLGLTLGRLAVLHVHDGQGDVDGGGDVLQHAPVLLDEGGAQGFVALHQFLERAAEGVDVELAGQAHGDGDVEGGAARVEPLLEPHPLLREGHGRTTRLTALVAQQLREPRALLFWGQRHRAMRIPGSRACRPQGVCSTASDTSQAGLNAKPRESPAGGTQ